MKSIFISLDFSENATCAAKIAADVAQSTNARLILFHQFRTCTNKATEKDQFVESERYVQQRLDKLARILQKNRKVSISRLIKPYSGSEDLLAVARLLQVNLVIICDTNPSDKVSTTVSDHPSMPTVTVSTSSPIDEPALGKLIRDQMYKLGSLANPLPETL